jgi:hypothetical protein
MLGGKYSANILNAEYIIIKYSPKLPLNLWKWFRQQGGFQSLNSVAGFLVRVFTEQNSRNKLGKSSLISVN